MTGGEAERIANLETVVRALARDVAALRAELHGAASSTPARPDPIAPPTAARAASPPPDSAPRAIPRPAPRAPSRAGFDLEGLVGRYGTMALAVLTIVMGVGAFLSWAVEHVRVGPAARVALGAALAAAIAATGWWLRGRAGGSARAYGNTLLGLALAIVHVDAWGAGPYLGVVSPGIALVVAAAASAALAALAFSSGEQALFAVGLGGALLAPFVTSSGEGTLAALLGYGLVVTAGACAALGSAAARGRRWKLARRIAGAGGAGYALAALPLPAEPASWPQQVAPPAFALLCAWIALALAGRDHRVPLARTLLAGALGALAARAVDVAAGGGRVWDVVPALVTTAALATATAFVAARLTEEDDGRSVFWGAILPIAFLIVAVLALPESRGVLGAGVAGSWTLLSLAAARLDLARRRQPALVVAGAAATTAVVLGLARHPVAGVAGLALVGTLLALLAARLAERGEPSRLVLFPSVFALVTGSLWAQTLLAQRPAYGYTPFLTRPSLAGLAAVGGWAAFAWIVARARWAQPTPIAVGAGATAGPPIPGRALVAALGVVAAFLWGREELARAFSRDLATFLLIGYYAAAGVAAIFVGRRRTVAGARRIGLALAVYAALKALSQSAGLDDVALRVGSFLVVGLFLLGVAYWYRATEGAERGTVDG